MRWAKNVCGRSEAFERSHGKRNRGSGHELSGKLIYVRRLESPVDHAPPPAILKFKQDDMSVFVPSALRRPCAQEAGGASR